MKYIKKKLVHIMLLVAVVTAVMSFAAIQDSAYAAVNDASDGVYFEEPYTTAGKTLTVKYDGAETNLEYRWFADGKAIDIGEESNGETVLSDVLEITAEHYQKVIKAQVWAGENLLGEASMFVSKLPVLYIDTEGGAEVVTKDYYINAQLHLQGNDKFSSEKNLYTGATEIKGRGNSTWKLFPKKPYRLKLDKKADLFGLGKSKHWVLLANYIDESGMRNMLAGELAERMGVGKMDGTWVEVVMNGENLGMYMLCEHVRLAEDRVDVFDWESAAEDIAEAIAEANGYSEDEMDALTDYMVEEDMSWISVGEVTFNGETYKTADYYEDLPDSFSGGYLMEMDNKYDEVSKFTTDNGAPIMFKSPEFINTDEIAMKTAQEYIQTFEDALYSKDFNTESEGRIVSYTEMCDVESFAAFWLASEMFMNEVGYKSTYFQKDIDQPLEFGPVWDFDYSSGSVSPFGKQDATEWTSDKYWAPGDKISKWWVGEAMGDPYFAVKVREEFLSQEEYLKYVIADNGLLKQWYDYLKESGQYNYEIWQYANGFDSDYEVLVSWLTERINWMDEQFATNESVMRSMGITFSDKFNVELKGDGVELNSGSSYSAEAGHEAYDLLVTVNEGSFAELNYYINSKYQGTVPVVDGKANIVVTEEQLTEDIGSDNVISVWLKDADGELTEQQYVTVKLVSDQVLYNVVFNDMGETYAVKVPAGEKVFIDEPKHHEYMEVFEGWSDGTETHDTGEWITVNGDVTLNGVWTVCSDGSYLHDFADKGEKLTCIKDNCHVTKAADKSYTKISSCALTCSNRYDNYYTGNEIKPVVTVSYNDELLVEGEHYTLDYRKTVNVGHGLYTIKGIESAGYTGEVTLSYRIVPRSITKATVVMPSTRVLSNGVAEPEVSLTYKGKNLVEGTDYELMFTDNAAVGTATATITGKGNFTGTATKTFDVVSSAKSISKCKVTGLGTKAYTGKVVKPALTVKDGSKKLVSGVDYTVTYSNNTKCGTAKAKITGVSKNGYKSTKTVSFNIRPAKITPKVTNVKYNQQKVTWSKVTGATSYKVYRSSNNKTYKLMKTVKTSSSRVYKSKGLEAGRTYYYKVRAVRKSGGTEYLGIKGDAVKLKTVLYKGEIKSAKNTAKGTATITWTGVNGAHGYKIYRSMTGKDGSFKLYKTVKNATKYKNTGLKKGKTYYYKVKPYRVVNGKNVYGALSVSKAVKIKK